MLRASRLTLGLAFAAGLILSACAPVVQGPGAAKVEPRLASAHFVASDGAILPVRSWVPEHPKAAVVALHGFNDYSNAFAQPGEFLRKAGVAVYAYDQRGFGLAPRRGLWPGTEGLVADAVQFVRKVRERHPGIPVYFLGESMGGAVALVAMTEPGAPAADGVILSAPAVWARNTMPWYQRALLATLASTTPWLELTGEGLEIQASDNIEMLRGLGRDPLVIKATRVDAMHGLVDLMDEAQARAAKLDQSTLVLYGEKDEVIPKEPIYRMLDKLPEGALARVALYERGYHLLLRDLSADLPWKDIAAWIGDQARPLPSGAEVHAAQVLALRDGAHSGRPWPAQGGTVVSKALAR